MARGNQELTADVYGEQYSTAQLQEIRRKLAKRANNSLRDLSRNSSPITGEAYNSYGAAVDALDYLKARNRRYFSESLNLESFDKIIYASGQSSYMLNASLAYFALLL